jgi:hypothetical protein
VDAPIISQCQSATWKLINSSALIAELNQTPDLERLQNVKKLLEYLGIIVCTVVKELDESLCF